MIKRSLSVILSFLLLSAVVPFSLTAQAKNVNKFVKSIKITKSATIRIPYSKTSMTKSFKVTVKGTASKKFTVKSSKPSVASVKISGSSIRVNAKKTGKAVITVTTKAKSKNGRKLSKKLTVKVRKDKDPVVESKEYLADYIMENGETLDTGVKGITLSYNDYVYAIIHDSSDDSITLMMDNMEGTYSGINLPYGHPKKVKFKLQSKEYDFSAETTIDTETYYEDEEMEFDIKSTNGETTLKSHKELSQLYLDCMLKGCNILLYQTFGEQICMNDLGFDNY